MKNIYYQKTALYTLLILFISLISACTKMPGRDLTKATSTFIYKVGTGSSVTLTSPAFRLAFVQANAGGPDVTVVSASSSSTADNIGFQFDATKTGTYTSSLGYFEVGTTQLNSSTTKGSITMNVTTYTFNASTLTGTIKGTFDGYMLDNTTSSQVKISGSFDITQ